LSPGSGDSLREHREWLLSLVPLTEPLTLVDLGCGRGDDLGALAARCTDRATRLVGVDVSPEAVPAAQTALRSDPGANIICERLDGRLPFDDGAIDVVFSYNFVECLSDPLEFTREFARILGPGGIVVAAHWDWDTQLFDGSDRALVRRLQAQDRYIYALTEFVYVGELV
jgi:SAM-dependent methyltransferase